MIKAHNLHRRYAEIKDQYHKYIEDVMVRGKVFNGHYPDVLAKTGHYPGAEHFVKHSLSIPINAHLTNTEVKQIVKAVEKVWKNNSI